MPESQHVRGVGPEAGTPQWNEATINVISYTCAAPAGMWKCEKKRGQLEMKPNITAISESI